MFIYSVYLIDKYIIGIKNKEAWKCKTYNDVGDQVSFKVTDLIEGKLKEKGDSDWYSDFSIELNRNTNDFDNFSSIKIEFDGLPSKEIQENSYSVLKDIFDEKLATYLAYAKDIDGLDEAKKNKISNDRQMFETLSSEDGLTTYLVYRSFYISSYTKKSLTMLA